MFKNANFHLDQAIEGLLDVRTAADDILISGENDNFE